MDLFRDNFVFMQIWLLEYICHHIYMDNIRPITHSTSSLSKMTQMSVSNENLQKLNFEDGEILCFVWVIKYEMANVVSMTTQ